MSYQWLYEMSLKYWEWRKHHWFWAKAAVVQHVDSGSLGWSLGSTSKLLSKQLEAWSFVFCLNPSIMEIYGVLLNGFFHKSSWFPWKFSSAKWNISYQNCRNSEKDQLISIWKCFCGIFWFIHVGYRISTLSAPLTGHFSQDIP